MRPSPRIGKKQLRGQVNEVNDESTASLNINIAGVSLRPKDDIEYPFHSTVI